MDCRQLDSSVHGNSRQKHWSGLPFPFPGDLPYSGTEPGSPELAGKFFIAEPPGNIYPVLEKYKSKLQ